MSGGSVVFIVSGVIALAGALCAVLMRNIFHNILGFALAMLGVAGIFLGLGADFLAIVFVLVYVGAVAIAMVYAVMLSHPLDQAPRPRNPLKVLAAALLALALASALWMMLVVQPWDRAIGERAGAGQVGARFLTDYVLAFELISVLLLVAMMGAVMVARRTQSGRGTW